MLYPFKLFISILSKYSFDHFHMIHFFYCVHLSHSFILFTFNIYLNWAIEGSNDTVLEMNIISNLGKWHESCDPM